MVVIHGTRKFLNRFGNPGPGEEASTTSLGSWYATLLFWRPQVVLFVNETTLLPAFVPLAPASGVVTRFRALLGDLLARHGCGRLFIEHELEEMNDHVLDKTRNRSVVGVMNEFAFLAKHHRSSDGVVDLQDLSVRLAHTPCGPLYRSHVTPDRALAAVAGSA